MKRKFGMMATALAVAVTGVLATKASPKTTLLTLVNCTQANITCSNMGTTACAYALNGCNQTTITKP